MPVFSKALAFTFQQLLTLIPCLQPGSEREFLFCLGHGFILVDKLLNSTGYLQPFPVRENLVSEICFTFPPNETAS